MSTRPMSTRLLAEFQNSETLLAAARQAQGRYPVLDAYSPLPIKGLADLLVPERPTRIRLAILAGGVAGAVFGTALQWYSAVVDLPILVGGRSLASWPDFVFATFELGILGAAMTGFIALLWGCGLPRLYDPLFDVPGFERATQDRFFLAVAAEEEATRDASWFLQSQGALAVHKVAADEAPR